MNHLNITNKKASSSPAITFFVLLVVALFIYSIFVFSTNKNKIKIDVVGGTFVDSVSMQENNIKHELFGVSRGAFLKTYDNVAKEGFYFNQVELKGEELVLGELREDWKNDFFNRFEKNFLLEVGALGLSDEIKSKFSKAEVFERNGDYYLKVSGFVFNSKINSEETFDLTYSPEIEISLNFEKYLLDDFEEILDSVKNCGNDQDCYRLKLDYFTVVVTPIKKDEVEKNKFMFNSKNIFSDLGNRKISFSFVEM